MKRTLLFILSVLLTTATAWAGNVTLSVDPDIAEGTAGHYYVNMPATGTSTLTLTDASITTFKVYDNGGKDGEYSNDCDGYLVINAPTGYKLRLTGFVRSLPNDYLKVYDGTELTEGNATTFEGVDVNIGAVESTGESMTLYFYSNIDDPFDGLDLTVTLIANPDFDITIADGITHGSVSADAATAKEGQTVTLTATPDEGYLLADVSVTSGGEAVALTWDVWTNSATFTMPAAAVTVTPTFTTKADLFAIIPKTGSRTVTIPEGVTSFKVYDDGGATGDYSANCDGWLELNLPDGYHFSFSGSVMTDASYNDRLGFYVGNSTNPTQFPKSETAGEPYNFTYNFDESIRLRFKSDASNQYAGVDLTVTLVGAEHNVTVVNADNVGGSVVTASVGGTSVTKAITGQTVTLTAAPANGYVLGALSVRDADGKVVDVSGDMLWYIDANTNTATFTMPNSDVTITPVFTNVLTADGGLTINMPMIRIKLDGTTSSVTKSITIPSGVTSFKVYDYGGPDCNYSDNYSGKLFLTAPEGCVLQLEGTITTQSGDGDYLDVSDGTSVDTDYNLLYLLHHVSSTADGVATAIPTVVSIENSISVTFTSDASVNYAGLDLTVTVISPGTDYSVTVSNGDTSKGTVQASTTTAQLGTTVTLTATPAAGYVLSDLSVTTGGRAVKTNWSVWTNSATFKMPNGDVTVTPTFTNDLGSLAVNLPATDYKFATIPEGVKSFKIYDDGGPTGNYTPYCQSHLNLTAPEGSLLRFTGSVTGPTDKFSLWIDYNEYTTTKNDIDFTSTDNKPHINLLATTYDANHTYGDTGAGLDLTATVLYAVNVPTSIANGTVTADKTHAAADETVTLTVAPATDCTIGSICINGQPLEAVGGVYSFKMPAKNVTVTAHFRKLLSHTDIAVADIPTQTYNGTALTPAVTVTDDGSPMTFDTDYTVSYENNTDAGTATVTITGIGNYDGTKTKTFAIDKATINPTVSITGWTYGDTPNAPSVTGNTGNGAVTYQYRLNANGAPGFSDAVPTFTGHYTVKATIAETANYKGGTATATFAIAQKPVTITGLSVENKAYDGTTTATITGTATVDGVIGSDDVSVYMGSAEFEDANVGTGKTVTFSGFYLIGESVHNYTLSAQPASVTAEITVKVVNYGAMTISEDETGKTATLDGDSDEPFAITNNILAKKVYFRSKFVADVPTTICLPFDFSKANFDNETFGTLNYVDENQETHQLVAHMTPVTELQANTPYYFEPTATTATPANQDYTEIVFDDVTIVADNAGSSTTGDWTIVGNYDRVKWTTDTTDPLYSSTHAAELGRAYGYAKKTKTVDGVTYQEGQFVKLGDGAHTRAFRAYMLAPATTDSPDLLPDAIDVVWDNEDGTTGVNEVKEVNEVNDNSWYTLDGRKLSGRPTQKGLYINNGRKVVIK